MAGVGGVPQESELSDDPSSINSSTEKTNSNEVSSQEGQIPSPSNITESAQIKSKTTTKETYPEETRLSGWLAKVGALGFVKTSRVFWFVFGDDTCKLYYYRNPQDLLPLGEIDISNAFFTFEPNVKDKPGLFEIRSEGKIHYLDAQERHKMVYWLQELQRKRREYSQKRTTISSERVQWTVKKRLQISGLLGDDVDDEDGGRVILEAPMDNIQVEQSFSGSKIPQWNLKKEIRDAVVSIRSNFKISGEGNRETPGSLSPDSGSSREDWTLLETEVPPTETLLPPNNTAAPFKSCPELQSPTSPVSKSNPQGKLLSTFKKLASKRSNTVTEGVYKDQRNKVVFPTCVRCKHINEDLITARDDLQATEEELQANREIVKLLQKEVDVQRTEINTMREVGSKSGEDRHEMLRQRDKHIVEMRHSMSSLDEECSQLKQNTKKGKMVKIQESELKTQREQVIMYQDMLEAKDQIIMKLTNQIYELEKLKGKNSVSPLPSPTLPAPVIIPNTKELETLRDSCQAYELQNKFLTKEILELNQLRQNDEAREKMLLINYAKLEADYYKTKSRYLILLKENQAPVMGGSESTRSQEIVNQLLQEAMDAESGDADNKHLHMASNSTQEYDRYGFQKCMFEDDEDILLARADQLQRQSAELANNIKVADEASSHQVKWENFMVNQSGRPLSRSLELKTLIRSGIPHEYREQVWKGCINMHVGQSRLKLGPGYYKSLVVRAKDTKSNPAAKQIELDLLRTLPNNRHFETLESDGIKKLRRILLAFSAQNMVIGYCQGLNRLAAIALLFLSEEEAFWCLVTIVEHLMPPDYFTTTLAAAQADQRVLKDLVQDKLPKLYSHFETHDVDLSLFTFNWFLTVFVDSVPTDTFLRVWDSFLYEGSKVLFRFSIAFLKYAEEGVLTQNTSFLVNRYMRTVGERMTYARGICKIAFYDLNPFPMRSIASKRQSHLHQIKLELAELDAIRRDFKSERVPDDRMDFYSDDELDDA
ncbi:TBC1 domain family member 2B-like isoform X1 [Haliotis rufescens]|uniref:TBC1 domain family member 2B-like isoform X1 n=1 Tax=Haliotis rufescens TaxID=6454 RepID=UPI00201F7A0C|nr:TBC1 domain family member 2B-like isoform X1 [Haliotis rufescens]